jgi:xylulokinase
LAAVLSGGGSLDWYRCLAGVTRPSSADLAGSEIDVALACRLAEAVPAGAEGLLFLPHLTGEAAPHVDPDARGAWFGLTRRHDQRHLARAVIEGVAFAVRGVVEAAEVLGGPAREIRVSGGGSHGRIWLRTLADVLNRPITAVGTADASARGAALLAMAAVTDNDPRALAAAWSAPGVPIEPEPKAVSRLEAQYAIFRELYPVTRHLMHRLADLDRPGVGSNEIEPR